MSKDDLNELKTIEQYFKSEYSGMLSYARHILMNDGLAEDAVQDTFQTAMKKSEAFLSSPDPVGWLYEALKNILRHALRDRQRYLRNTVPLDHVAEEAVSTEGVQLSLTTLYGDDEEMKLLIMFYVYGFSIRELAELLGISEGACKMRIKRAREKKKKVFEKI